jgi:hypothetical protein
MEPLPFNLPLALPLKFKQVSCVKKPGLEGAYELLLLSEIDYNLNFLL